MTVAPWDDVPDERQCDVCGAWTPGGIECPECPPEPGDTERLIPNTMSSMSDSYP